MAKLCDKPSPDWFVLKGICCIIKVHIRLGNRPQVYSGTSRTQSQQDHLNLYPYQTIMLVK